MKREASCSAGRRGDRPGRRRVSREESETGGASCPLQQGPGAGDPGVLGHLHPDSGQPPFRGLPGSLVHSPGCISAGQRTPRWRPSSGASCGGLGRQRWRSWNPPSSALFWGAHAPNTVPAPVRVGCGEQACSQGAGPPERPRSVPGGHAKATSASRGDSSRHSGTSGCLPTGATQSGGCNRETSPLHNATEQARGSAGPDARPSQRPP